MDNAVLVEALGRGVRADSIVVDADVLASMSRDEAEWADARLGGGWRPGPQRVRRAARGAHMRGAGCAGCAPRRGHRTVRRRERRHRLRDPRPVADGPRAGDRRRQPAVRRTAWRSQQRRQGSRRRAWTVVSARPGERAVVDDWRQCRDQRRRPVLPQVRRDPRLRAGPAGRCRRPCRLRPGRPARPTPNILFCSGGPYASVRCLRPMAAG